MACRRLWWAVAFAPLLCGTVITACGSTPELPPLIGGPYEAGSGGGNPGSGGGEGGGNSECVTQGGQCSLPGNVIDGGGTSCPVVLSYSCGPGSVSDTGMPVLVCCGGYNDAGGPDVIFDTGVQ